MTVFIGGNIKLVISTNILRHWKVHKQNKCKLIWTLMQLYTMSNMQLYTRDCKSKSVIIMLAWNNKSVYAN